MRKINDSGLLSIIALCAIVSLPMPWWHITMHAPQYPDGLRVTVGLFSVNGDVAEVDDLNHYIGFRPLATIAPLERRFAWLGIPAALLPLLGALRARKCRAPWISAVPVALIPIFFACDLAAWMRYAGHHLDPHAALSSSVAPWTPNFLGAGGVGQFHTFAMFDAGFVFAAAATVLTTVLIVRSVRRSQAAQVSIGSGVRAA